MRRTQLLLIGIKTMFALLILAFLFILFRSLSGPSRIGYAAKNFDNVQIGETTLRRYQKQRVWVTRLSPQQRQQAALLNSVVRNSNSACSSTLDLCVLPAQTQRDGIELRFTQLPPPQLPANLPWYGGFVDPVNSATFDRLGRIYQYVSTTTSNLQAIKLETTKNTTPSR